MKTKLTLLFLLLATTSFAQRSVSILGDSYSTYQGYITPETNETWYWDPWIDDRTDVSDVKQTWWWQVCANCRLKLERNNSYSGATICYTGYNGDDYSARSFITRAKDLGSPDIILVFGGTNDSWAHSPLGESKYSGWTKEDLKAYRPAMACLGQYLYNRYPNTDVYFIQNTDLKPEVCKEMNEVCKRMGFTVITLHDISKTQGHPNIEGMKAIADQVTAVLKQSSQKRKAGKGERNGKRKRGHKRNKTSQEP